MPIGAIAGATAVAGVGSAVIGASSQKKAANKAAGTATQNTAANNAMSREMYANNAARLDQYSANGLRASNALSDMLLGPAPATTGQSGTATPVGTGSSALSPQAGMLNGALGFAGGSPGTSPQPGQPSVGGGTDWAAYVNANPDALANWNAIQGTTHDDTFNGSLAAFGQHHYVSDGSRRDLTAFQPQRSPGAVTPPAPNALSAWDQFRNSTNYQFREQQGLEGMNQGYAARGILQSGAAQKALGEWNSNFAANELGNYQNLLAGQQNMGLTASSALAGVGQSMVGQVTANNNSAAGVAANAALASGAANAGMWGNIGSSIGNAAGMMGSSYNLKRYGGL
jgi:hypothetical protein